MSTAVDAAPDIRRFGNGVADEHIDDLRGRIAATRWPTMGTGASARAASRARRA